MRQLAKILPGVTVAFALCAGAAEAGGKDYVLLAHPEAIDGRSFTDDSGKRYRLHAVDAPEIGQQCIGADGEKYMCGEQSRHALAEMIDGILTCDLVGSQNTEWRSVRCYDFSGRDIGSRLISDGWAVPDRSVGTFDYVMDEMEAEARQLGLWQGRFVTPNRWRAGARL
jgi:endonuclease YncB( thermonuclease family)